MHGVRIWCGVTVLAAATALMSVGCADVVDLNQLADSLIDSFASNGPANAGAQPADGNSSPAGYAGDPRPTDPLGPGDDPIDDVFLLDEGLVEDVNGVVEGFDAQAVDPAEKSNAFRALAKPLDPETEMVPVDTEPVDATFGEAGELYRVPNGDSVRVALDDLTPYVAGDDEDPEFVEHGWLAGLFWNDGRDGDSFVNPGVFRGRWMAADGQPLGVLRGHYHPVPADMLPPGIVAGGLFHGKYVDMRGRFRGILHGRYGRGEDNIPRFFGRWYDRDMRLAGVLMGHWWDIPPTRGGVFAGRWAAFDICEEILSLPWHEFDPGDVGDLDPNDYIVPDQPDLPDVPPLGLLPAEEAGDTWRQANGPDDPDDNPPPPPCIDPALPFGVFHGRHIPFPPDGETPLPGGELHGAWHGMPSESFGFLNGYYMPLGEPEDPNAAPPEQPPSGGIIHGVFFAVYGDPGGNVVGYLRGAYGRSTHRLGVFRGEYLDADLMVIDEIFGRSSIGIPRIPGGPFSGVFKGDPALPAPPE